MIDSILTVEAMPRRRRQASRRGRRARRSKAAHASPSPSNGAPRSGAPGVLQLHPPPDGGETPA